MGVCADIFWNSPLDESCLDLKDLFHVQDLELSPLHQMTGAFPFPIFGIKINKQNELLTEEMNALASHLKFYRFLETFHLSMILEFSQALLRLLAY